jgi:hypothetical protein
MTKHDWHKHKTRAGVYVPFFPKIKTKIKIKIKNGKKTQE